MESLECAVVLQSGVVVIYRLRSGSDSTAPHREASNQEIVILEHIPSHPGSRFYAYFMLIPEKGLVTVCAISDIGAFEVLSKGASKLSPH
jgi:hypothetical protein